MKKKNGFISISIVYTFFVVFLLLLVLVISNYINNRLTLNIYKLDIKEHIASTTEEKDDEAKNRVKISDYVENLAKTDTTNLSTDTHGTYTNTRYVGINPNNYVCFEDGSNGCINYSKDNASNKTGGLFRIIGVFNEDTHGQTGQKLVKVLTADNIGNSSLRWDYKQSGVGSSTSTRGSNDWSDSQLMYMLNGYVASSNHSGYSYNSSTYYISDGTRNIYKLNNGLSYLTGGGTTKALYIPAKTAKSGWSSTATVNVQTLTSKQANMIENVTWHLGGNPALATNAETYYTKERGTEVKTGRPTTWTGKIGLMYPSDYGYATTGSGGSGTSSTRKTCLSINLIKWKDIDMNCNNYNWLYYTGARTGNNGTAISHFTITPRTNDDEYNNSRIYDVYVDGYVSSNFVSDYEKYEPSVVHASFYLKNDVYITGGTGTSTDPYRLAMD